VFITYCIPRGKFSSNANIGFWSKTSFAVVEEEVEYPLDPEWAYRSEGEGRREQHCVFLRPSDLEFLRLLRNP